LKKNFLVPLHSLNILRNMEAVVITPRTKSDILFIMDFAKRIGVFAQTVDAEDIADAHFISLIENGLQTPSVSRDKVMEALSQ